ncbi:MAG TPA: sugar phosphate isomerase [Desulfobacteraceae bacterium]|nr:sugar phosphate isomerase [Desulfobacteraceae bacterium]|tara:strand:+ start:236 stop:1057 length:822 start_codon:yes stop_codon:yes gene_type:complete
MVEVKKQRPFRLGTTSFIYPDHIIPNVRKIGPYFDEIELLVFESIPKEVIPSAEDVQVLKALGEDLQLTYNIHLPVDISLTSYLGPERQKAADILNRVLERFAPIAPTSHTLHLDMDRDLRDGQSIAEWKDHARQGLELWVPGLDDPGMISVETLWYDPGHLTSLIEDFNLSVCLDAGHHFKYGYDLAKSFRLFDGRIPLMHLHGVDFGARDSNGRPKDHQGLDRFSEEHFGQVVEELTGFKGTVSLEVFNLCNLKASLTVLDRVFESIPEFN